jgi:protoporphyrinogen oxidase
MKVLILGGGLAGLSSGYELSKEGVEVDVIEKDPEVGGFAKSFSKNGFTYDLGPHRFHSSDAHIIEHLKGLLKENIVVRNRISRIYINKKFIDYPLKTGNAVFKMPFFTTLHILYDYIKIKVENKIRKRKDDSFESWVVNRFGNKLYQIYFKPYTEKSWGIPCTEISVDWAAQRISLLSLWDTVKNTVFKPKNVPRTYVSKFYYPLKGGIGSIAEAYAEGIKSGKGQVFLNSEIKKINPDKKEVVCVQSSKECVYKYDKLLSTIPLTSFVELADAPKDIIEAASKLQFRPVVFVYLVVNKSKVMDDHWIYLPEKGFVSNRVSEFKNFSEENAPSNKTIVCAEVTCCYKDKVWFMEEELINKVIGDFVKLNFIKEDDVEDSFIYRMEHSYPIYALDYKEHLDKIKEYLDSIDSLEYFGRNALFRYNNMDHSVDMGLKVAKKILEGNGNYKEVATGEKWFG